MIDKMIREMLKDGMPSLRGLEGLKGGLEGMEKDLMFSMVADIMKHEGTDKLHIITTLTKKDHGKNKSEMCVEMGMLDLDGLKDDFEKTKYHVRSLEQQIKLLEKEIYNKKSVNRNLSKKLDELRKENRKYKEQADELGNSLINKSKKIVNLENEIKELKKNVPCETDTLKGKTIATTSDFIYGSLEDIHMEDDILKLLQCGIMEIKDKNFIVKSGTIAKITTDKHGYDFMIELGETRICLEMGLLEEMIEQSEIAFDII